MNTKAKNFLVGGLLASALISLTACGFHPLHGNYGRTPESHITTGQVKIGIIPDREGQILRNELIDRLGQNENAPYYLSVSKVEEDETELAVNKSSETTRTQLRLKTHMTLADANGKVVLTRDLQSITSYNILTSEFATRVTETGARDNALEDLARQIELQINLYLK